MKKALYFSAATALLFAMIFAGCDTGVQENLNEQRQTYPALSAPANLKASVKSGYIAIGWDVVKDATGYEVYRRDTVAQDSTRIASLGGGDKTSYVDKVGYSNQLVDKRKYTYTVVAKGKEIGRDNLLLNGAASVDATANIPAKGSEVIAAENAVKNLKARPIVVDNQDFLEVTWTGDEILNYSVYYFYSDGTVPIWYNTWENGAVKGTVERRQTIPFVGGKTTVKVTATWDNDAWYANVEKSQTFTAAATLLPDVDVENFNVVRTGTTGIYTLEWDAVDGATDYSIWRAELINSFDSTAYANGEITASWPSSTLGDWQPVTGTSSRRDGDRYTLVETDVDPSKTWLYGIIATNSGAKSGTLSTKEVAASAPAIITSFGQANITGSYDAGGHPQVTIEVDALNGETIKKLERAPAIFESATSTLPKSIGAYTEVTDKTAVGSHYTWLDNPTIRTSYAYKLTVKKGDLLKEMVAYKKDGSFTPFFVTDASNNVTINAEKSTEKVYSITIKLAHTPADAYMDDVLADIWQAETSGNGQTGTISGWTKITTESQPFETLRDDGFTKTSLTLAKWYIYRVELTSTENADAKLDAPAQSAARQPSVTAAPGTYTWVFTTSPDNSSLAVYTASSLSTTSPLDGGRAFVVVNDGGYKLALTEDGANISAFLNKAEVALTSPSPAVPKGAYFALFSASELKKLNSSATAKNYYLAVEQANGTYTTFGNYFTVTNGTVTNW